MRHLLGFNDYLENIIKKNNVKIIFNKFRFQKLRENISTCSRHVSIRCRLAELELNEYKNFIIHSHYNSDDLVTILTLVSIPHNENLVKLIKKHT